MRKLLAISCLCAIAVFAVLLVMTVANKELSDQLAHGSPSELPLNSALEPVDGEVADKHSRPSLTLYPVPLRGGDALTPSNSTSSTSQARTSAEPMSELAYFLQSNPDVMLEVIGGYKVGAEQSEQGLRRAEQLALALVDKGAPAKQLTKTFAAVVDGESLIEMRLFRISARSLSTAAVPSSVGRTRQLWFDEDNQLVQLDEDTRRYMSEVIALLNRRPDLQLQVVGTIAAAQSLPKAAADALALERAETVAELLTRFGLQPGRASVKSAATVHRPVASSSEPLDSVTVVKLKVVALSL